MKNKAGLGLAAVALLGAGGVVTSIVRALPPGSPATPGMTLSPAAGDASARPIDTSVGLRTA
jgi:hypothetical protein